MRKSLIALFVTATLVPTSYAADVYRYRDNMPAAEMMLKLMDLFGVVDRISDPYAPAYAGSGFIQSNSDEMNFMRYLQTVQGMQQPNQFASSLGGMNPLGFSGMQMNPLLGSMGTNPFASPMPQNGHQYGQQNFSNSSQLPQESFPQVTQEQIPGIASNGKNQIPGFFSNTDIAKITQNAKRDVLAKSGSTSSTATQSQQTLSSSAIGLDGTWRNATNEVLMIDKDRFIWEDGKGRDLTGYLKVTATTLTANVPKTKGVMIFQYALKGNRLSVLDPKSRQAFHFIRGRR